MSKPRHIPYYASKTKFIHRLIHDKKLVRDTAIRWFYEICSLVRPISSTFTFQKKTLTYSKHRYNKTWSNERSLEIPIALAFVHKAQRHSLLEIGNTLSHYITPYWTIIDKFEPGVGVINKDIINYRPKKKFDYILSISTIEHIGVDDSVLDPKKSIAALKHIRSLLSNKGQALITFPVGYNQALDKVAPQIFNKLYCYKRISAINLWIPVSPMEISTSRYGFPYNNANCLVIGIMNYS
jgi:hypothetical protein